MIGHNPELKGDVHPIQCPVNALGEVNEEHTYGKASRTADVTDGKIKKNHLRHLPLGLNLYINTTQCHLIRSMNYFH